MNRHCDERHKRGGGGSRREFRLARTAAANKVYRGRAMRNLGASNAAELARIATLACLTPAKSQPAAPPVSRFAISAP